MFILSERADQLNSDGHALRSDEMRNRDAGNMEQRPAAAHDRISHDEAFSCDAAARWWLAGRARRHDRIDGLHEVAQSSPDSLRAGEHREVFRIGHLAPKLDDIENVRVEQIAMIVVFPGV